MRDLTMAPVPTVTKDSTVRNAHGWFITEHSDQNWPIGRWPNAVTFTGTEGGAILLLRDKAIEDAEGDLQVMIYRNAARTLELHILND